MKDPKPFVCPRCGDYREDYPALSRTDNTTDVCSECGVMEALESFSSSLMPQDKWIINYTGLARTWSQ